MGNGSPARGEGSSLILSLIAGKKLEAPDLELDWDAVPLDGGFITWENTDREIKKQDKNGKEA